MNRFIVLMLGLLVLTGCTALPDVISPDSGPQAPAPTYFQVTQDLEKLKDSDAVAKEERRKSNENALPRDSTAFNLRPVRGDSALDKAMIDCHKRIKAYAKLSTRYNALPRPRASAPKGDPNAEGVRLWNTINTRTPGSVFTCGEKEPESKDPR